LNPREPAELQETALPCLSVIVTIVLLNVERICATPDSIFFFTRRFLLSVFCAIGLARLHHFFFSCLSSYDVDLCVYGSCSSFFNRHTEGCVGDIRFIEN